MTDKDPYVVLEISRQATSEEIQKAYRNKAKLYHPDRNIGDPKAEEKFREIQTAYDILNDPLKKSNFDRYGFSDRNFGHDIFQGFMNDMYGRSVHKGRNIQVKVEITLEEVATGCNKKITFSKSKLCNSCRGSGSLKSDKCKICNGSGMQNLNVQGAAMINFQTPCHGCKGSGKTVLENCEECRGSGYESINEQATMDVTIPAGSNTGHIRLAEQGDPSRQYGGINGDLLIFVSVLKHELFNRHDNHLVVDVPLSFYELVNGCELDMTNIYKQKIKVKIPKNTMPNSQIRVQRNGLPGGMDGIGDLFLIPKLDLPKNMSDEYYQLMDKIHNLELENPSTRKKEWNRKISKYSQGEK